VSGSFWRVLAIILTTASGIFDGGPSMAPTESRSKPGAEINQRKRPRKEFIGMLIDKAKAIPPSFIISKIRRAVNTEGDSEWVRSLLGGWGLLVPAILALPAQDDRWRWMGRFEIRAAGAPRRATPSTTKVAPGDCGRHLLSSAHTNQSI